MFLLRGKKGVVRRQGWSGDQEDNLGRRGSSVVVMCVLGPWFLLVVLFIVLRILWSKIVSLVLFCFGSWSFN